jgi:hypothetical protein
MIGSIIDRLAFKAWPLGPRSAINVSMHSNNLWSCAQWKSASPIDTRSLLLIARMVSEPTYTKCKGLPIDVSFYLLYFLHVQHCVQKVRGSRSTSHSISYTFYTHSSAYKKHGAPDRCPILSLIRFTHVAPQTKGKGLLIDIPFYFWYILHAQCCVQKARGSQAEYHNTFHTQQSSAYEKQGHLYTYIHHPGIQQDHFLMSL